MTVKIVLRNPLNHRDLVDYTIVPADNVLAKDWLVALKLLLKSDNLLEKNFCFLGFPATARTLEYLCNQVNDAIVTINNFFDDYEIKETFTPAACRHHTYPNFPGVNHEVLNILHNHFEILQGTVTSLSEYYQRANYETKYAIRQLNIICHEIESLVLSQRRLATDPYWVRPSQITTFLAAPRYDLKEAHKEGFAINGYDRQLGGVYMHWAQIGKTLQEVYRDEDAPELTDTVCEAITELKYYSGEFDIEWGNNIKYGEQDWHTKEQDGFNEWLIKNGKDPKDTSLSLGYLPIGQVDLEKSFGSTDSQIIWDVLGSHLDIYKIEVDGVSATFDYCWTDSEYKQQQIDMMRPGYDYSSRRK